MDWITGRLDYSGLPRERAQACRGIGVAEERDSLMRQDGKIKAGFQCGGLSGPAQAGAIRWMARKNNPGSQSRQLAQTDD
ncbi:hypothetical protein ACG33_01120 [Steroidobacter denitrificans]|uniref:Uncharacterized protein n=1 Tax=Steroidobacter denitrificans TaxID=465721 RepID=A0A127F801_STEDE|nr:hypothetical protein ACG33_01120 [Steroidobacter denitrificans]